MKITDELRQYLVDNHNLAPEANDSLVCAYAGMLCAIDHGARDEMIAVCEWTGEDLRQFLVEGLEALKVSPMQIVVHGVEGEWTEATDSRTVAKLG